MHPTVSVIIPVYNVQDYLEQCLDSVIKQTYRELEIIMVNDGSTDMSGSLATQNLGPVGCITNRFLIS